MFTVVHKVVITTKKITPSKITFLAQAGFRKDGHWDFEDVVFDTSHGDDFMDGDIFSVPAEIVYSISMKKV
ncbi:MAG: hypothetical protein MJA29_00635 [Candidatus Omnitrophica bacterium]|nr:hypothetical protein [Candidatus Omnitrophota bacterium]